MRNLNLDPLRTLISIADLGSFSAAAQALRLAQPTVSLHVSGLESRVRVVEVLLLELSRAQGLRDAKDRLVDDSHFIATRGNECLI